jgi:Mg-chelatase subunit ChlI
MRPGVGKSTIVKAILRILAAKEVTALHSDDYPFSCGGFLIMTSAYEHHGEDEEAEI